MAVAPNTKGKTWLPGWHNSKYVRRCGTVWTSIGCSVHPPWSRRPHPPAGLSTIGWVLSIPLKLTFCVTPSILSSPPRTTSPGIYKYVDACVAKLFWQKNKKLATVYHLLDQVSISPSMVPVVVGRQQGGQCHLMGPKIGNWRGPQQVCIFLHKTRLQEIYTPGP